MGFKHEQTFPFTMDTAWEALHKTSSLDVAPGNIVTVISDAEWTTHPADSEENTSATTYYIATFDNEKKRVTIKSTSDAKREPDFIYLTLEEISSAEVKLMIEVDINTGIHFIAKVVSALLLKPMEQLLCKHICQNFEALCTGKETKRMDREELDALVKDFFS